MSEALEPTTEQIRALEDAGYLVVPVEGFAARVARAICETEGFDWTGTNNSREDVERWFGLGYDIGRKLAVPSS